MNAERPLYDEIARFQAKNRPYLRRAGSQDEYCAGCAHIDACNVMLKDGEECGDRYEITAVDLTPAGREARHEADPRLSGISIPPVGGQPGRTIYGDWND